MEDKKVLDFINKNHERAYKDFLKQKRKDEIKENIQLFGLLIILIVCFMTLMLCLKKDTEKAVNACMEKGYSYKYCIKGL